MSRLNEMNQALRRQYPRSQWLLELATPTVALGRGLPRSEPTAKPRAANTNHPIIGLLESVVRTAVRAIKSRHTANQLRQLDTHLLDDIGIARSEIDRVATQAAARQAVFAMPRFALLTDLLTALRKAWKRQAAIAALQRLSDHTLSDIGIERRRIAATVDAMLAHDAAKPAPKAAKAAAPKPVATPAPAQQVAA